MKKNSIVTIVPTLPPAINGLGDFGYALSKNLHDLYNVQNTFIITDKYYEVKTSFSFPTYFIPVNSADSLFKFLKNHSPESIILHYVGYAYSKTGYPFGLLKGLENFKQQNPGCKIITIFHELYADGNIFQKAFYTKPLQKKVALDLFELSDASITNTSTTYNILKEKNCNKKLLFLPVYSNVGEETNIKRFNERENNLIVFGSGSLRKKVFDNSSELLFWTEKLGIEKIIEIGPARSDQDKLNIPTIEYKGELSSDKISFILRNSKFGMIHYPEHLLTKSGVFASYIAHGVLPVITGVKEQNSENKENDYLYLIKAKTQMLDPDKMIQFNFTRYNQSNQLKTTEVIYNLIQETN